MDRMSLVRKGTEYLKKYRYLILVLVIGLVLMTIPSKKNEQKAVIEQTVKPQAQYESIREELERLLSQIDGAGKVKVMLTVAAGEETVYQTNEDMRTGDETGSASHSTVTVTDTDRNQTGLVKQINPPVYLGAVIVCQGADKANVRLAITEAVSKITGLGADRISVLKMK